MVRLDQEGEEREDWFCGPKRVTFYWLKWKRNLESWRWEKWRWVCGRKVYLVDVVDERRRGMEGEAKKVESNGIGSILSGFGRGLAKFTGGIVDSVDGVVEEEVGKVMVKGGFT